MLLCPQELVAFFLSDDSRWALSQRPRFRLFSLLDCFGRRAVTLTNRLSRSQLSHPPLKRAYLPGGLRRPPSLITESSYIFFTVRLRVAGHCGNEPDVRSRRESQIFRIKYAGIEKHGPQTSMYTTIHILSAKPHF